MSEESHLPRKSPSSLDPSLFDIRAEWVQENEQACRELEIERQLAATYISSGNDEKDWQEPQTQDFDAQIDLSAERETEKLTNPKEAPSSATNPTSTVNNNFVSKRGGEATTSLGEDINFNVSGILTSIQDSLGTPDSDRIRLNDLPFEFIPGTSYYTPRGTKPDMSCSQLARDLMKKNAILRAATNTFVEEPKEIAEEMLRKYIVCVRPLTPKEETMADIKAELSWQHVWMGEDMANNDGLTFGLSPDQKVPFQDAKWHHKVQVRKKLADGTFSAPLGKESPLEKRVREKWEAKQHAKKEQESAVEQEKACAGDVEMTDVDV